MSCCDDDGPDRDTLGIDCRTDFRIAEVEYCRFSVSARFGADGDFDRERDGDRLVVPVCCNVIAVGRGPISFRYASSSVGGLTMNPETMILAMDSKLDVRIHEVESTCRR